MSEIVDQVGQAIIDAGYNSATAKSIARIAIAAMREPTAAQGRAMYAAWDAFGEDAIMGPKEAIAIYRAAIDEALK